MSKREPEHHRDDGVKYENVKIGEYVDMGAGCILERRAKKWVQWDGGYGLEVCKSRVKKWLE